MIKTSTGKSSRANNEKLVNVLRDLFDREIMPFVRSWKNWNLAEWSSNVTDRNNSTQTRDWLAKTLSPQALNNAKDPVETFNKALSTSALALDPEFQSERLTLVSSEMRDSYRLSRLIFKANLRYSELAISLDELDYQRVALTTEFQNEHENKLRLNVLYHYLRFNNAVEALVKPFEKKRDESPVGIPKEHLTTPILEETKTGFRCLLLEVCSEHIATQVVNVWADGGYRLIIDQIILTRLSYIRDKYPETTVNIDNVDVVFSEYLTYIKINWPLFMLIYYQIGKAYNTATIKSNLRILFLTGTDGRTNIS